MQGEHLCECALASVCSDAGLGMPHLVVCGKPKHARDSNQRNLLPIAYTCLFQNRRSVFSSSCLLNIFLKPLFASQDHLPVPLPPLPPLVRHDGHRLDRGGGVRGDLRAALHGGPHGTAQRAARLPGRGLQDGGSQAERHRGGGEALRINEKRIMIYHGI